MCGHLCKGDVPMVHGYTPDGPFISIWTRLVEMCKRACQFLVPGSKVHVVTIQTISHQKPEKGCNNSRKPSSVKGKKVSVGKGQKVSVGKGKKVPAGKGQKVPAGKGQKVPAGKGKKVPVGKGKKISCTRTLKAHQVVIERLPLKKAMKSKLPVVQKPSTEKRKSVCDTPPSKVASKDKTSNEKQPRNSEGGKSSQATLSQPLFTKPTEVMDIDSEYIKFIGSLPPTSLIPRQLPEMTAKLSSSQAPLDKPSSVIGPSGEQSSPSSQISSDGEEEFRKKDCRCLKCTTPSYISAHLQLSQEWKESQARKAKLRKEARKVVTCEE